MRWMAMACFTVCVSGIDSTHSAEGAHTLGAREDHGDKVPKGGQCNTNFQTHRGAECLCSHHQFRFELVVAFLTFGAKRIAMPRSDSLVVMVL
jgi:hypothetical protein